MNCDPLLDQLAEALRHLPRIEAAEFPPCQEVDGLLSLRYGDQEAKVHIECKQRASPRLVQEAIYRMKRFSEISLFAAPSLSEECRALLKDQGIAYWDAGGSLYLELPWGVYFIDRPPPGYARESREPKNLYRGRTAQVLHALLLEPEREWKVTELADVAGVSTFTAHQTLNYLEEQLWVAKHGRGPRTVRRLLEPGKLLDAWAARDVIADYSVVRFHRLAQNLAAQESALFGLLEQSGAPWVLTLEHGVQRVAPYVHQLPSTMVAIVPDNQSWRELAKGAGFREVDEGENLLLLTSKETTPFLGRQHIENAWVASPIQLYLDLFHWPRRGREQARQLRSQVLGF